MNLHLMSLESGSTIFSNASFLLFVALTMSAVPSDFVDIEFKSS